MTSARSPSQDLDLKPQRHIPALDGIRGIAILMVLSVHFLYTSAFPVAPPAWLHVFHTLQFGWMGVDLFFVLSGFLITGILLDTRASSNYFRSFYVRRALRIFPLYYLVVSADIFLAPWQQHIPWLALGVPDRTLRLAFFTYTNNWIQPFAINSGRSLSAFWSLAVEEQFYLIWPGLLYLLHRRHFAGLCLAICLVLPFLRFALEPWNHFFVFMNTSTRMDSLVWGALAALLVRSPELWKRIRPLLPLVALLCAATFLVIAFPLHELYSRARYTQSLGFTVVALGFSAVLLLAYHSDSIDGGFARALRHPILTRFGRYSYGIYLLHGFVIEALVFVAAPRAWFGHSVIGAILLFLVFHALCFVLAWLSYNAYERRFLGLKNRFAPTARDSRTRPDLYTAAQSE